MRAEHINCFITAVKHVFSTMLNTEVAIGKPQVQPVGQATHDVTGIIGLSGDAAVAVALSLPLDTAANAVEAFSGTRFAPTDDGFTDAIGELANMISGSAKKDLANMDVSISIPTVVVGQNQRLGRHSLGPWIVLECRCPLGNFSLEVCMVETPVAAAAGGAQ
jgi:chemotaxis protein CheX